MERAVARLERAVCLATGQPRAPIATGTSVAVAASSEARAWYEDRTRGPDSTWAKPILFPYSEYSSNSSGWT